MLEGQLAAPPGSPQDGQCWLVGSGATGAWTGKAGQLACFCSGNWLFAQPRDGMIALDRQAGQIVRFAGGWHQASRPAVPSGGATVDSQARSAIAEVVAALTTAEFYPLPDPRQSNAFRLPAVLLALTVFSSRFMEFRLEIAA